MEHRGEKRGKQAGSGIRRRATFHEGLEHFVKYYVFTKNARETRSSLLVAQKTINGGEKSKSCLLFASTPNPFAMKGTQRDVKLY